jgi:uncharacterized protein (TIGR02996 family)
MVLVYRRQVACFLLCNKRELPVTDEQLFLQAIISNPDDDNLRLVFADWLEDQGQCDRAEFIRTQFALANLGESDPRGTTFKARIQELLERYAEEWLGPLRGWAVHWKFGKGFVEEITVPVQVYLDHVASITRLAPIRRIEVDLSEAEIPRAIVECIPESVAREHVAFPIGKRGFGLVVAVRDPADSQTITMLKFILNREIEPVAAPIEQIIHMINRSYDETELESVTTTCFIHESYLEFYEASNDISPVGRLVNLIIQEAIAMGAKEIQIEPDEDRLRVRYRINGELVERDTPPRRLLPEIVERLRFLSSPNPGRIRGSCQGTPFDFGCEIQETPYGPCVVITM